MHRKNGLGDLRRSAVVSNAGPGAIVDFRAGDAPVSAVISGLSEWDRRSPPAGIANPQSVFEPRLQKQLGVAGFRVPPVFVDEKEAELKALPAVRFPRWLQCPTCHVIKPADRWNQEPGKADRRCGVCTAAAPGGRPVYVVPVRFVCACEKGHLDDFPWQKWGRHKDSCRKKERANLMLESEGAGLAGLQLKCCECHEGRSLEGIFSKKALAGFRCRGLRPWTAGRAEACDRTPRVLQRGASNLYFPVVRSALDIPPWSDAVQRLLGQFWDPICGIQDPSERAKFVRAVHPSLGLNMSPDALVEYVENRLRILEGGDSSNLRWDEYLQFTSASASVGDEDAEFQIRPGKVPPSLKGHLGHVVRAVRLREVRAITGFTRIHPPADPDDTDLADVVAIRSGNLKWLPAIEVRGEGIFMGLDPDSVAAWESAPEVSSRAAELDARFQFLFHERYGPDREPVRQVTARFLLLHTLAHIMIRELALDCGYSSASLRERLYASDGATPMCGLLIYTATSDSDGTLGGLVRQGRSARIEVLLRHAIANARWCSSDPLCIHGMTAAAEALNIAACHSCVLISETSCEEYNQFLDRAMLVDSRFGYFRELLHPGEPT